jgi:hypothetical protein
MSSTLPRHTTPERKAYEEACAGVQFTREPNAVLETLMHDPMATNGERFTAWLHRNSWGRYRLYAMRPDGSDATQADSAAELRIDAGHISHVVAYQEKRGYLRREGKRLIPVIAPQLGPRGFDPSGKRSGDFSKFLDTWKVDHAAEYEEMQAARATVERIRKVAVVEFRKLRASATNAACKVARVGNEKLRASATNAAPVIIERVREVSEEDKATTTAVPPSVAPVAEFVVVAERLGEYGTCTERAGKKLLAECRKAVPDCIVEVVIEAIDRVGHTIRENGRVRPNITNPVGLLIAAVPGTVVAIAAQYAKDREQEKIGRRTEDEKTARAILSNSSEWGQPDIEWARGILGEKAKGAGQ